jgi:hypothetical protein
VRGSEPKAIVLAAYRAANAGRYQAANRLVAPEFWRQAARDHARLRASVLASNTRIRRILARIRARRDPAAIAGRNRLRALIKLNGMLLRIPSPVTAQSRRLNWNAATHGRSLAKIEATRQAIQGSRARVHLRLTLRDGTVVSDSEPLVFYRGSWLLG